MLCRFLVSSIFPNFRGSPSGLTLPSIGSGEIETIPRTVTPTGLLPLDCRNKSFSGLKQNFSFHWNEVTNLQHPILFLFFLHCGWRSNESSGKQEVGAPGNLWESLEWLRVRFLPQMPCQEELEADACGLWQPFSVEGKGSFQFLPRAKEKHYWAGSSPALAYSLYGCCVEGKPFPHQPMSPCPWICHHSPSNPASLSPLTHICSQPFCQTWILPHRLSCLFVLSYLQATRKVPSPSKSQVSGSCSKHWVNS